METLVIILFWVVLMAAGYILAISEHLEDNDSEKQSKHEFKKTKEEKDKIFVDNALIIMAKVMAADRTNMVCELDIIKQFIKRYDEAHFKERVKFVKEYALKFKNYNETALSDCDNLIETINKVSNFTRKKWFLEYLFEIAFSDGSCSAEEKLFLKRITEKLDGMNSSTYNIYEKKYQKKNQTFTGTRDTEEYSQYEYESTDNDSTSSNKYSSYSQNGSSYNTGSYYKSTGSNSSYSSNTSKPLTELQKAYAALDLTEDATDKEIKARRRNLMRLNHPDLVANKGEAAVNMANLRCQEINKAFELIKATRGMK
ncbi:MAG: TerB family tellurite resistance protein [Paludibacteraceae bacterium]|nr:TerB family tellurite resistance protein [Paludibacteraceae bacterium]